MFKQAGLLSGADWQQYVIRLLTLRYGFSLVEVPDTGGGDRGIEAFSLDGCAYQCYGPQQVMKIGDLYKAQKKKVDDDIQKFIDNEADLKGIFGTTKISKWILVVPHLSSYRLNQHCKSKVKDVLAAKLPYVDGKTFEIIVVTEAHFPIEVEKLLNAGAVQLQTEGVQQVSEKDVDKWISENSTFVKTIDEKLKALPSFTSAEHRLAFIKDLLALYLDGSNTLEALKRSYPYIYEEIRKAKAHRGRTLKVDSKIGKTSISDTQTDFGKELEQKVKGIDATIADLLSYASVAEWLGVCNLTPKA
jgi:hypothetical protein